MSTAWNWLVTKLSRSDKPVIFKRGANCVFQWGEFVVKVPEAGTQQFDAEVAAIQEIPGAVAYGFVEASVVEPGVELHCAIPYGVPTPARAIMMPKLSGVTLVNADLDSIDPHIICAAIIDCNSRLVGDGWYLTDCKLDNIQLLPSGEVRFLDWGSLCRSDCRCPIFTYCVQDHHASAKTCMSVNVLIAITELFGNFAPPETTLSVEQYRRLTEDVLALLEDPYRSRLQRLLAVLL